MNVLSTRDCVMSLRSNPFDTDLGIAVMLEFKTALLLQIAVIVELLHGATYTHILKDI